MNGEGVPRSRAWAASYRRRRGEREHGHDHDAEPVQVRCAYNDEIVLDAGFYSRRREINPNSSFSVNG